MEFVSNEILTVKQAKTTMVATDIHAAQPAAAHSWYIFRYKTMTKVIKDYFTAHPDKVYLPYRKVRQFHEDSRKVDYIEQPSIPGYIFVHANIDEAITLGQDVKLNPWRKRDDLIGKTREQCYYSITDDAMRQFIRAVELDAQNFSLLAADSIDLSKKDFVEIIAGNFKGYRGYLKSVNGSNGGLVIIPLLDEEDTQKTKSLPQNRRQSLLHYGIPTNASEIAILSFAKGSHRATDQINHAGKVVDKLLTAYSAGEKITGQQSSRLLGYVHRFRQLQTDSHIQRTNLALLLYRVYTILELTTEIEAMRRTLENEILPECEQRMHNATNRDKASVARTYRNCLLKKEEADAALASRRNALTSKSPTL